MNKLVLSVVALVALALCACAGTSKEVAMARTARYQGDKLAIFADLRAAMETSGETLVKTDETQLLVQTKSKWFSPEGLSQNPRGEGTEMIDLVDKSVNITMVVRMLPDGDYWVVKNEPVIMRYNRGIPKPEPLKEGDISLPGWVQAKFDTLMIDINKGLKKYEVQTVPGPVPAGQSPAAPAGSAAPAEAGSAAAPAEAGSAAAPAAP